MTIQAWFVLGTCLVYGLLATLWTRSKLDSNETGNGRVEPEPLAVDNEDDVLFLPAPRTLPPARGDWRTRSYWDEALLVIGGIVMVFITTYLFRWWQLGDASEVAWAAKHPERVAQYAEDLRNWFFQLGFGGLVGGILAGFAEKIIASGIHKKTWKHMPKGAKKRITLVFGNILGGFVTIIMLYWALKLFAYLFLPGWLLGALSFGWPFLLGLVAFVGLPWALFQIIKSGPMELFQSIGALIGVAAISKGKGGNKEKEDKKDPEEQAEELRGAAKKLRKQAERLLERAATATPPQDEELREQARNLRKAAAKKENRAFELDPTGGDDFEEGED